MTQTSAIKKWGVAKDWESTKWLKAGAGWVWPTGKFWSGVSNWPRASTHHFLEGLGFYGFEKEDGREKDYRFGFPSSFSDLKYVHHSQPFLESLCGSAGKSTATPAICNNNLLQFSHQDAVRHAAKIPF